MPTVLLIERDEEAAFVLNSMLTSLGCEMEHCTHPHEALFSLQDNAPDLMLLSMPLSGMSAAAFLSSLKSITSVNDTPVLGMAEPGSQYEAELSALASRGLSGQLRRPVTRADLTTMLSRWTSPDRPPETGPATTRRAPPASPSTPDVANVSLAEKLSQNVSVASVSSVLHQSIGRPPRPPAPPSRPLPQPDVDGPKLQAFLGGERRQMTIEMAIGKNMMVWAEGEHIGVGTEFGGELSYKDPAPGRNRMIKLDLKLTVGNSSTAGEGCIRCSLRVDDVRPAERWDQFVRVCKASTADHN